MITIGPLPGPYASGAAGSPQALVFETTADFALVFPTSGVFPAPVTVRALSPGFDEAARVIVKIGGTPGVADGTTIFDAAFSTFVFLSNPLVDEDMNTPFFLVANPGGVQRVKLILAASALDTITANNITIKLGGPAPAIPDAGGGPAGPNAIPGPSDLVYDAVAASQFAIALLQNPRS